MVAPLKFKTMKPIYLLFIALIILTSCSTDDDHYATVTGRVERKLNQQIVAGHEVTVRTAKMEGSGLFSRQIILDEETVITDTNGDFAVDLKTATNAYVIITHNGGEDFSGSGIFTNYSIDAPVIIKVEKYYKVHVRVRNDSPYDAVDYLSIRTTASSLPVATGVRVNKITNLGIANQDYVETYAQNGYYGSTVWEGENVNSIIEYNVPETAEWFKILWFKRKNGIGTDHSSENIIPVEDQIIFYNLDY